MQILNPSRKHCNCATPSAAIETVGPVGPFSVKRHGAAALQNLAEIATIRKARQPREFSGAQRPRAAIIEKLHVLPDAFDRTHTDSAAPLFVFHRLATSFQPYH